MTRVYLADAQPIARAALGLLLRDLAMQVVGEGADWSSTLANTAATAPDLLVVDASILPAGAAALSDLRATCPSAVIVLLSAVSARQQAALSAGADAFISKSETPDRVADGLRAAAARAPILPATLPHSSSDR